LVDADTITNDAKQEAPYGCAKANANDPSDTLNFTCPYIGEDYSDMMADVNAGSFDSLAEGGCQLA
jgi:hypothetical protein